MANESTMYGIQAEVHISQSDQSDWLNSSEWREYLQELAEEIKVVAEHDRYPEGHATPGHGMQPPGLYRLSYQAFVEKSPKGNYLHAVVANPEPEAIWIEQGFHPGGSSTHVPGRYIMRKAMDIVLGQVGNN